jgi:hypothetical protein
MSTVFVVEEREFVFVDRLARESVSGDNHPDSVYTGASAVDSSTGFDLDWNSDCVHDSSLCVVTGRGYAVRNHDGNGGVIGVQDFGDGV